MIQRIQTVYLLVAAGVLGLFLGLVDAWGPLVDAAAAGSFAGEAAPGPARTAVLVVAGLLVAVTLLAVFLYRDRGRQAQVVGGAMIVDLMLALAMMSAVGYTMLGADAPMSQGFGFQATAALIPVAAYLFLHLARRGVKRDVDLIKSVDRLR
jgi:hypothetical protein